MCARSSCTTARTGRFPTSLDDLTKPKMGSLRYLRQAYKDPMNKEDGSWRLIYVGPAGQLIGSLKPPQTLQMQGAGQPGTPAAALAGQGTTSQSAFGSSQSSFGSSQSSFGSSQSAFGSSKAHSDPKVDREQPAPQVPPAQRKATQRHQAAVTRCQTRRRRRRPTHRASLAAISSELEARLIASR